MTRNLFFACALLAAAVLATGWALAPGCKGSFCLGSSYKTGTERARAGASEVPGAGREILGGNAQVTAPAAAPQASFSTADTQASWNDAEPFEEQGETAAAPAPETTSGVWQGESVTRTQRAGRSGSRLDAFDEDEEPELSYKERKALAAAAAKAAEDWEGLADAAINEPDDELRGQAIQSVGVHRHSAAVAVLNEVAAFDPSPDNRLQAIEQLWYSAADGLDSNGMIRSTLETALDDPDEPVAKLAERALADLAALEEARDYN